MDHENTRRQERQEDCLSQLAEQFRSWRAERVVGSKIPEQLWEQACKLESEYGFGAVSHACRLNYVQFRRRLGLPESPRKEKQTTRAASHQAPQFLDAGVLGGSLGSECRIEVDAQSRGMTIHLSGSCKAQASAIINELWELMR